MTLDNVDHDTGGMPAMICVLDFFLTSLEV